MEVTYYSQKSTMEVTYCSQKSTMEVTYYSRFQNSRWKKIFKSHCINVCENIHFLLP